MVASMQEGTPGLRTEAWKLRAAPNESLKSSCVLCGKPKEEGDGLNDEHVMPKWVLRRTPTGGTGATITTGYSHYSSDGYRNVIPLCAEKDGCNSDLGKRYENPLANAFTRKSLDRISDAFLAEWSILVLAKSLYMSRMLNLFSEEHYDALGGYSFLDFARRITMERCKVDASSVSILRFDCYDEGGPFYSVLNSSNALLFACNGKAFLVYFDGGYLKEACASVQNLLSMGPPISRTQALDVFVSLASYSTPMGVGAEYVVAGAEPARIHFTMEELDSPNTLFGLFDRATSRAALLDVWFPMIRTLLDSRVKSLIVDNQGNRRVLGTDEMSLARLNAWAMSPTDLAEKKRLPHSYSRMKHIPTADWRGLARDVGKEWKKLSQTKLVLPQGETELARLILTDQHAEAAALQGHDRERYLVREVAAVLTEKGALFFRSEREAATMVFALEFLHATLGPAYTGP